MARASSRDILAYVLSKTGCVHPFLASRIIALAETSYYKARRERLTDLKYVGDPGTFYIEGLKELVDRDECFARREGDPSIGKRGCIEYRCEQPQLASEVKRLLDEAIEEVKRLGEFEVNKMLVEDEVFKKLLEEG
ncbi:MAG: hypothetical protein ABWW69_01585 [Pyrodictiaceae archaeon]